MFLNNQILEYEKPYKELKEDVVVHILVLKEDIAWLLQVHSVDQRDSAVIPVRLYIVPTRKPRRAGKTEPEALCKNSETSSSHSPFTVAEVDSTGKRRPHHQLC